MSLEEFKAKVLARQIRNALRKGRSYCSNVPASDLAAVEGDHRMRKPAAAKCKELLQAAREALEADKKQGDALVALPSALLDCEDEEVCGTSVPFGNRNWQLVLLTQRVDGDCAERTCLLRDPQTDRFATPPHPMQWSAADKETPGPCGPYHFDRTGSAYLVEHWLCVGDAPCQDVGGETLGWREQGPVVGE